MKYPKRSQYKHAKSRYRVRNWAEYEAGLRRRGDLTVWLSDAALDAPRHGTKLSAGEGQKVSNRKADEVFTDDDPSFLLEDRHRVHP
jgi:hypothetical protein